MAFGWLFRKSSFAPSVTRGKEIGSEEQKLQEALSRRALKEHSGPHMPWFWEGELQGGGVLNDMMCHLLKRLGLC